MQAAAVNRHLLLQQQLRPHSQWTQTHRLLVLLPQPPLQANSRQPPQAAMRSKVLRLVQMLLLVWLLVQPPLLTAWMLISQPRLLHNPMLLTPLHLSQLQQREPPLLSQQQRLVAMLQLQRPPHQQPQQRRSRRLNGSGSGSSSAWRMLACQRLPRGLWLSHCRLSPSAGTWMRKWM
jgi:hypothetical protein